MSVAQVDDGECSPHCPKCGSDNLDEYRMGIIRYRCSGSGSTFVRVMAGSEDPIFRRCIACDYGDASGDWERSYMHDHQEEDG